MRTGEHTTQAKVASPSQTVSVSQIRQSRQRIELDVLRLHNRIQLLEAEEGKANKIIEDTKTKVKTMLKSRATAKHQSGNNHNTPYMISGTTTSTTKTTAFRRRNHSLNGPNRRLPPMDL